QRLYLNDPAHAAEMTKVVKAIIYGQTATVIGEIDSGLSPNAPLIMSPPPQKNGSLLGLAVAACQYGVVKQLVAAGASINGVNGSVAPLMGAVGNGEFPIAEYLIQKGANVNVIDPASDESLLGTAVLSRQPKMVKLLVEHNANPNRLTSRGKTLLGITSRSANPVDQEIAKILRAHGARSEPAPQQQPGTN
ncbi:MAG: ankyrin repeat domain-containing protein, partial [Bryobacteraceae bacterium]